MNRLTRILAWPLVAFLSLIVCGAFVAATIGGVIEMIRK